MQQYLNRDGHHVMAEQITSPMRLVIGKTTLTGEPGQWLVELQSGHLTVWTDEKFRETFRPVG